MYGVEVDEEVYEEVLLFELIILKDSCLLVDVVGRIGL